MSVEKSSLPEWSDRIHRLLDDLKLTQAGLAERVGVSPPTVSRWIQGRQEPTAESYIGLGNLARRPDGVYFWERAGMDTSFIPETGSIRSISSLRVNLEDFKVIPSSKIGRDVGGKGIAVAIPLLGVTAYGDRIPPKENVSLSSVELEEVLLAPLSWCPHPEHMVAMHLSGDSMSPVIAPGAVLFVDTEAVDREQLHQRIAVVSHRDLGFKVARFQRVGGIDLLVSANHKYVPLDVSNASKWRIFGEVLWWVSREGVPEG
ncbi:MAG: XRE family transcriptional regulator [Terracidiphilus sp.]|jgi:transcriptional regulator with XRE-family HTH domain